MRAQIRVLESVAVLIIFFIILVIGSSIYFGIQKSNLAKEEFAFENKESLNLLVKVQSLPELDCSFASAHTSNCFDLYKLESFSSIVDEEDAKLFYYSLFGNVKISVSTLFPERLNFTLYDVPLEDYSSMLTKTLPVLVYDPVSSRYYFAISEVVKYA